MQTPPVLEKFVNACKSALASDSPRTTIYREMQALLADPAALGAQVPAFTDDDVETSERGWRLGGEHVLHRSENLTVMLLDTLPGVVQPPHDHNMNVFIGVFEGCEEQRFWLRTSAGAVPAAGRLLCAGEIMPLGEQAIHAISAPTNQPARAIHVYLGDIYDVERSVFDPDTLVEHPMTSVRYDEFCRATTGDHDLGPQLRAALNDFAASSKATF